MMKNDRYYIYTSDERRSTVPFFFVNDKSKVGQLIRSSMFSFLAKPNSSMVLYLQLMINGQEALFLKFEFVANDKMQIINEKYSIKFELNDDDMYYCPTLYIN